MYNVAKKIQKLLKEYDVENGHLNDYLKGVK